MFIIRLKVSSKALQHPQISNLRDIVHLQIFSFFYFIIIIMWTVLNIGNGFGDRVSLGYIPFSVSILFGNIEFVYNSDGVYKFTFHISSVLCNIMNKYYNC